MNNADVPHRWAQRAGGSGKGSNFFYDGDTIYSHGRHFPIAKHMDSPKGVHFIAFNPETYSTSTARHQSYTRRAIADSVTIIHVDPRDTLTQWVGYLKARCESTYKKFKAARTNKPWHATSFASLQSQLQFLKEQYDLDLVIPEIENMAALLEQQKLREEEQERAKAILAAADVDAWKRGTRSQCPHTKKIHLRVNGENIETSWGANVPLAVAPGLWTAVETCRTTKSVYLPIETFAVGHYRLTKIHENGNVAIGCHLIHYDELRRIAIQLNYVKE